MDVVHQMIGFFQWLMGLAKPENLRQLVTLGGYAWISYAILFAIVFSETGLLIGFFLPGDSLLFAAGFLASQDVFNIWLLNLVLIAAAILGDWVNYHLGRQAGQHVFEKGRLRFIKHEHLLAARAFYERHGGMAIILARFVPLVRTFTPFVAGVAHMKYSQFAVYNIVGGIAWVVSISWAGYWLGQFEIIKKNFEAVVVLLVLVSVMPIVIGGLKNWLAKRKPVAPTGDQGTLEMADSAAPSEA